MDRQHIETVVRRWTEAIATGRLDIFKELLAETSSIGAYPRQRA